MKFIMAMFVMAKFIMARVHRHENVIYIEVLL